ncbi:hypothetical protein CGLO_10514 [Colletotrichum gloeosporioides Cg-14]|uniref:Uncharacterized protein n=1 Tax=Colletotrichum gloeosporioides (strain Cg-14) TaxID=1237896 RepID=T0KDC2_COLGC|nr:hypothetical protein CGLO_10514 [Colletotrichum gloeosporioides Cg-14]
MSKSELQLCDLKAASGLKGIY